MTKSFRELEAKMSSKSRARAAARARKMLDEMDLQDIRRERELTQQRVARSLDTDQANISRLEQRADMFISTLREYVAALGGTLELIAHFDDGDIRIGQFDDLRKN